MSVIKKRLFEDEIHEWYLNNSGLSLVVKGARQVGKTTGILNWAHNNNIKMYYLDLSKVEPELITLLANSKSATDVISQISIFTHDDLKDIKVLFLDEIQIHPNLMYLTRLFLNNKIKLICSGSLLGLKISSKATRTDVGSKIYLEVFPLDFEEFLLWVNQPLLLKEIKEHFKTFKQINLAIHQKLLQLYDQYLIVGGMPKVVSNYVDNNYKFNQLIYQEKASILEDYMNDNQDVVKVTDYYTNTNIKIANLIYSNIDNYVINPKSKKFIISELNKNYKYKNILIPLDLLKQTNIVFSSNNVSSISYPLKHHSIDGSFKLYYSDIGLLTHKLGLNEQRIFNWQNNKQISDLMGGVIESSVIVNLRKKELFYYSWSENGHSYEIDLLWTEHDKLDIIPIEIKSKSGSHKLSSSLNRYITNFNPKKVYCIGPNNFAKNACKYFIPYYASFMLKK